MTSQPQSNNSSSNLFSPNKTENDVELINEVSQLLSDKELSEHLHLLDVSDMEDEPYSPTESTTTISNNQSTVTSTAHSESSDSDSETDSSDSDSDSSSSGEESSDEEEQKQKPKPTQNAKTKTSETNTRYEDEDDDIIILDHEEFKDDISAPEQLMIHANCYVTRDILAKPDQSTHTKITALVAEGDSTSYLQGTFYADLTSKARQAILQSTLLQSLQKDGISIQLHVPKIHYTATNGKDTKVPLPINPNNMANMPMPKQLNTCGNNHVMFSIYFTMIMDYHHLIDKEIQRRQARLQRQTQTKASQMERLLANKPNLTYPILTYPNTINSKTSTSIPTSTTPEVNKAPQRPEVQPALTSVYPSAHKRPHQQTSELNKTKEPPCKASRIEPPSSKPKTLIKSDFNTRSNKEITHIIHRTHKTMTTLHKRRPIFERLGPCVKSQHTRPHKQQKRSNQRRQWRRRQAILDINNN